MQAFIIEIGSFRNYEEYKRLKPAVEFVRAQQPNLTQEESLKVARQLTEAQQRVNSLNKILTHSVPGVKI